MQETIENEPNASLVNVREKRKGERELFAHVINITALIPPSSFKGALVISHKDEIGVCTGILLKHCLNSL